MLADSEITQLARFITWVRRQWKDRAPEGRRDFERTLEDAATGLGVERVWKLQHDDLLARYSADIDRETSDLRRTLARVEQLYLDNVRTRKTIRTADLGSALGKG